MTYYRLSVLGDPVEHSLSPLIHRAGLQAAGLAGTYEARTVTPGGMEAAVDEIRTGRLFGASVTMPYKQLAAELADEHAAEVTAAGIANTLVNRSTGVAAHNTDVAGIRRAWEWAGLPPTAPALILGGGGAAAAAVVARMTSGVAVSTRRPQAAAALLARLGAAGETVAWGMAPGGHVIVNATPLGMHGEALPAGVLEDAVGLFDMAYGPGKTPAVEAAERLGIPVATGPDMLLGQAIDAFEIWTGRTAPESAMRLALTTERQRRAV